MDESIQKLNDWVAAVHDFDPTPWERLPELDLYMDQVITLMGKQLELFQVGEERLLTSSMINNYVKGGVLPRPSQKKYSRDHLAMLTMICMLKSVLSLPEIQETMHGLDAENRVETLYPDFSSMELRALGGVVERIREMPDQSEESLYRMAMELAVEANARRTAAARILSCLKQEEPKETKKEKSKRKRPNSCQRIIPFPAETLSAGKGIILLCWMLFVKSPCMCTIRRLRCASGPSSAISSNGRITAWGRSAGWRWRRRTRLRPASSFTTRR